MSSLPPPSSRPFSATSAPSSGSASEPTSAETSTPTPAARPTPPAAPAAQALLPPILPIEPDQPLRWVVLGFRDLCRNPLLSLAHGVLTTVVGALVTLLAYDRFWLLLACVSVFMVCAPVLATSLYAMSRAIERGERVDLGLLLSTWTRWHLRLQSQPDSYWALIRFGLLLGLAALGWVLTSAALIELMAPLPIRTPMDFLRHVVASQEHHLFEIWLALGALLVTPLFASSVVSMPLLLDRRVSVLQAVLTSWKVVLGHPITMAFWAFLLMGFSLLGIFSLFLGLILIVPMLGHASWHAYRDCVDASHLPPRLDDEPTDPTIPTDHTDLPANPKHACPTQANKDGGQP